MNRLRLPLAPYVAHVLMLVVALVSTLPAQEQPKGFNQYKRVHQDALKKIVGGELEEAVTDLKAILETLPREPETHYMLAFAHARAGRHQAALDAIDQAVQAGLPVERFVAGTKTFEPLHAEARFQRIQDSMRRPAHGPMLGCLTGSTVKVWLRTAGARRVQVSAWKLGHRDQVTTSDTVTTTADTDYTAVLELKGLEPNTRYEYAVALDEQPYREAVYRFRTLADPGRPVRFRIAFGGGAGFVPQHEYMWNTIRAEEPDVLLLLGDNVYSDAPKIPEMQHYCYYRRQSRPEYRRLIASSSVFSIWDDHDFGTNDCSGGPERFQPFWKLPVYKVFRNNWVNPYYGGGETQPGCYYDVYLGDVHFVMLDGRYYRNLKPNPGEAPTMLGPVQKQWLKDTIAASKGNLLVLCSPVPWVFKAKGDSKDTWNGFKQERNEIFDLLSEQRKQGVLLMSADRHRSDLWKIERPDDYPLYEFNSSRLTNQHVHKEMAEAMFSYNKKQSFGTVDIDTTKDHPTIVYRIVSIDGEEVHRFEVTRSQLVSP